MSKRSYNVAVLKCSHEGCDKTVRAHRWGKTRAEDWFFQKDDHQWCPAHHPPWVEQWRAERKGQP